MNDQFSFVNRMTPYPELSYNICIAENMKKLYNNTAVRGLGDHMTEPDLKTIFKLFEEPVYSISASSFDQLTETVVYNYSRKLVFVDLYALSVTLPFHFINLIIFLCFFFGFYTTNRRCTGIAVFQTGEPLD